MRMLATAYALTLVTGCYDPGAQARAEPPPLAATPHHAAPKLIGKAAVRAPGAAGDVAASDVEACVLGAGSGLCASSAEDGSYALGPLAPSSRYRVRYAKAGLVPLIMDYDLPEHSIAADVFLFTVDAIALSARRQGVAHDLSASAGVVVSVHTITYDGIVPLAGARASALGDAQFTYAGATNDLDGSLDGTTTSGWALALGVKPGSHRLELSHSDPAATCGHFAPHTGVFEDSIVVDAVAGALTVATAYCFR